MNADKTYRLTNRVPIWVYGVLAACLAYAVWTVALGWHNTILDFFGFRQTQTALTAYFMVNQTPRLAYETPVVGPPWSIPFEFPIYQWIVAAVVAVADTPMDESGRAVSLSFFLLTLVPAYRLLAWLGLTRPHRLLALSLFVVSPFYLFWSRTFLIESTALFFGLCYLAASLPAVDEARPMRLSAALLFGVLAALVKITTWFVFSLLILLYLIRVWLSSGRACFGERQQIISPLPASGREGLGVRGTLPATQEPLTPNPSPLSTGERGEERSPLGFRSRMLCRMGLLALLLLGVPLAAGWSWTRFTDEQKARNPIGQYLRTSSPPMHEWNYGTAEQRFSRDTWESIWQRTDYVLGHRFVLVLALLAVILTRRHWRTFIVCILVYPIAPLVFTNLYWFHEYYAYANNVLLIAATALALVGLLERGGVYRAAGLAAGGVLLALAVWRHQTYYAPIQTRNCEELNAVCRVVREATQSEDVLVVLGCDWSSEVPYYSRRRALCVPPWVNPSPEKLADYLHLPPPYRVGAVVIRGQSPTFERTTVEDAINRAGFTARYRRVDEQFEVYVVEQLLP